MRENELLAHIYGKAEAQDVVIPPGDDMGAVRVAGRVVLAAVDQLVEGVHFETGTDWVKVGRKAVTRNLSDVAAMAAQPIGAVAAGCLPRGMQDSDAKALVDAIHATGLAYGCPVFGGDLAAHDGPAVLSVTVLAEPAGIEPVLRSGAKPGDGVYVTGALGNSFASGRHLAFEPRLRAARALAEVSRPSAMMDVSDGLAQDLPRLLAGFGVAIDAEALPIHADVAGEATQRVHHAVCDGEDYELVFTHGGDVPREVEGVAVTRIGTVLPDPADWPGWLRGGWEHGQ